MSAQNQSSREGETAKVYFADLRARNHHDSKMNKVARLFDAAGFSGLIRKNAATTHLQVRCSPASLWIKSGKPEVARS